MLWYCVPYGAGIRGSYTAHATFYNPAPLRGRRSTTFHAIGLSVTVLRAYGAANSGRPVPVIHN